MFYAYCVTACDNAASWFLTYRSVQGAVKREPLAYKRSKEIAPKLDLILWTDWKADNEWKKLMHDIIRSSTYDILEQQKIA